MAVWEPAFAAAGRLVLSNAKNYRMAADVPLLIPEVNWPHVALLALVVTGPVVTTDRDALVLDERHSYAAFARSATTRPAFLSTTSMAPACTRRSMPP